jgi:hypothetical protein
MFKSKVRPDAFSVARSMVQIDGAPYYVCAIYVCALCVSVCVCVCVCVCDCVCVCVDDCVSVCRWCRVRARACVRITTSVDVVSTLRLLTQK